MGKQKKDSLIKDLVDDLTEARDEDELDYKIISEGSIVDFSTLTSQKVESDDILELDVDDESHLIVDQHSEEIDKPTESPIFNPQTQEVDNSSPVDNNKNGDATEFSAMAEDFSQPDKEDPQEDDLDEEQLVKAYEETLAGELISEAAGELAKEDAYAEADDAAEEDPLDYTEKVDLDLYNSATPYQNSLEPVSPAESKLAIAENFRIAKLKLRNLEKENEKLTLENEELTIAAETFRNKVDALEAQVKSFNKKLDDQKEGAKIEKEILMNSIAEKEHEVNKIAQKSSQLENRVQMNVRKVKVRERELENRLELVKLEGKALLKSKDEMILNLKKQIDKLNGEIEALRTRVQESNRLVSHKQEVMRKTVKSLRLALSLLEVEDVHGNKNPLKKVD